MRKLFWLAFLGGLAYVAFTVPLGERTLAEHAKRIWNTEEARDMRNDVKEASGPLADKIKRGVKAGVHELIKPEDVDPNAAAEPAQATVEPTPESVTAPKSVKDGE